MPSNDISARSCLKSVVTVRDCVDLGKGGVIAMANVKVTCPHCRRQTWVRKGYNDPCEYCKKIILQD
jgi:hypothetical protein